MRRADFDFYVNNGALRGAFLGEKMKRNVKNIICILAVFAALICLASCFRGEKNVWEDAIYTEDTQLGIGEKTVTVKVEAGNKSVIFTIKTDAQVLGDALAEHNLVDGEMGDFGLYIKKVNGMTADYDKDRTYWGFYKNGEYMLTGIDGTYFEDGECYELVLSK